MSFSAWQKRPGALSPRASARWRLLPPNSPALKLGEAGYLGGVGKARICILPAAPVLPPRRAAAPRRARAALPGGAASGTGGQRGQAAPRVSAGPTRALRCQREEPLGFAFRRHGPPWAAGCRTSSPASAASRLAREGTPAVPRERRFKRGRCGAGPGLRRPVKYSINKTLQSPFNNSRNEMVETGPCKLLAGV